jgi:hypothetical protein
MTSSATTQAPTTGTDPAAEGEKHAAALAWMESEFPGWTIEVNETLTSRGTTELWVATAEGHHPQSELTLMKLRNRLRDYTSRAAGRERIAAKARQS